MYNMIKKSMARLNRDEEGATLVEYGIALSLAIALGGAAFTQLGNDVGATYTAASTALPVQVAASGT